MLCFLFLVFNALLKLESNFVIGYKKTKTTLMGFLVPGNKKNKSNFNGVFGSVVPGYKKTKATLMGSWFFVTKEKKATLMGSGPLCRCRWMVLNNTPLV